MLEHIRRRCDGHHHRARACGRGRYLWCFWCPRCSRSTAYTTNSWSSPSLYARRCELSSCVSSCAACATSHEPDPCDVWFRVAAPAVSDGCRQPLVDGPRVRCCQAIPSSPPPGNRSCANFSHPALARSAPDEGAVTGASVSSLALVDASLAPRRRGPSASTTSHRRREFLHDALPQLLTGRRIRSC